MLERGLGKLLEVYLPVRTPDGHRLLYEEYLRYSAIAGSSRRQWLALLPAFGGALAGPRARPAAARVVAGATPAAARARARGVARAARRVLGSRAQATGTGAPRGTGAGAGGTCLAPQRRRAACRPAARRRSCKTARPPRARRSATCARCSSGCTRRTCAASASTTRSADVAAPLRDGGVEVRARHRGRPRPAHRKRRRSSTASPRRRCATRTSTRRPSHVEVCLRRQDGHARLRIRDDGRGFTPEELDDRHADGHRGLALLHDLAADAGGRLNVRERSRPRHHASSSTRPSRDPRPHRRRPPARPRRPAAAARRARRHHRRRSRRRRRRGRFASPAELRSRRRADGPRDAGQERRRDDPRTARRAMPAAAVVVLTSFSDRERILDALDAGAVGYLLKDADADELARAIRAAPRGRRPASSAGRARAARSARTAPRDLQLTEREQEVLAPRSPQGLPNKLIAQAPRHQRAHGQGPPDAHLRAHRRHRPHAGRAVGTRARPRVGVELDHCVEQLAWRVGRLVEAVESRRYRRVSRGTRGHRPLGAPAATSRPNE